MKEIIIENERIINATDYEARCKEIIDSLNEAFFDAIDEDAYDRAETPEGETIEVKKNKKFSKYQILPELTPMQVSAKLNEMLRIYKPMSETDAKTLDDTEYLDALKWYMHLISHINKYLVFLPSKQTFCGFANITADVYNKMLQDQNFVQVFNSIEDYIVDSNFLGSKSGMVDSKTTLTQLQTKDAGHNLVRNPESITINQFNPIDKQRIQSQMLKFDSMIKKVGNSNKSGK